MPEDTEDITDYNSDPEVAKAREMWIVRYFSWSDDIGEEEVHTARDGFDAGVAWYERKLAKQIDPLTNV